MGISQFFKIKICIERFSNSFVHELDICDNTNWTQNFQTLSSVTHFLPEIEKCISHNTLILCEISHPCPNFDGC